MEVLRVRNISKSIKNKQIINEISFNISEGQIVGLLGPNGAGKTTTFYSILGLIKIDSGEVFLNDKNITCLLYTSPSPRDTEVSRMPSSA